jgi:hypothetical protein
LNAFVDIVQSQAAPKASFVGHKLFKFEALPRYDQVLGSFGHVGSAFGRMIAA